MAARLPPAPGRCVVAGPLPRACGTGQDLPQDLLLGRRWLAFAHGPFRWAPGETPAASGLAGHLSTSYPIVGFRRSISSGSLHGMAQALVTAPPNRHNLATVRRAPDRGASASQVSVGEPAVLARAWRQPGRGGRLCRAGLVCAVSVACRGVACREPRLPSDGALRRSCAGASHNRICRRRRAARSVARRRAGLAPARMREAELT
jgi:hypothetical protein